MTPQSDEPAMTDSGEQTELASLTARLARAEAALEALQDQVYRQAERHERELAEVHRLLKPAAIARALSDDARDRGL
jgi:hypothetical protein